MDKKLQIDTTARPTIFEWAFLSGTALADSRLNATFYTIELGDIKIESGRIIVCDPVEMHTAPALTKIFPKGTFPVQLAMGKDRDEPYVAYFRIRFSGNPVYKWQPAYRPGERERDISERSYYSFYGEGIGIGVGLIIDSAAGKAFNKDSHQKWGDVFINTFNRSGKKGLVHPFGKHNLAAYKGFNGFDFRVYIGFDVRGQVCRLLVDGGMFIIPPSLY